MAKDLTVGNPGKVLTVFAIPMVVSVVFQQLYNIADNIVAGKFIGDAALAAVSVSYPVTMIYMAVALGINIGSSVVISQIFGSKQYGKMKTAVSTALISSTIVALLLTVLGFCCMNPLLRLLKTPAEIFGQTREYLLIYTAGLVFIFLYNICTGTFNALGDSLTPLFFLIASSLGNIFMDIWFVKGFGMGVEGCAWATFICQGLAAVLAFVVLMVRLRTLHAAKHKLFSMPLLKQISKLAVPGILQQSFISVGNLLIQRNVNSYELASVIGGYGAAVKLNTFAVTLFVTLSNSVSSFSAQNIGARRHDRVHRGHHSGLKLGLLLSVPFILFYELAGDVAMRLFAKNDSVDVIAVGVQYLRIVSPFYLILQFKMASDGVLHGAGAVNQFMTSTFTDLILRVVLAAVLPHWFGYAGIWMAWPVGWVISTALSLSFYYGGKWKEVRFLDAEEPVPESV